MFHRVYHLRMVRALSLGDEFEHIEPVSPLAIDMPCRQQKRGLIGKKRIWGVARKFRPGVLFGSLRLLDRSLEQALNLSPAAALLNRFQDQ